MPEGLFDRPLEVVRPALPAGFPEHFRLDRVVLPPRDGTDALAPAPQLEGPDGPDHAVRVAAAVATWCGEDAGQLDVRVASARAAGTEFPLLHLDDLDVAPRAVVDDPRSPLRRVGASEPVPWVQAVHVRPGAGCEYGLVPYGQVPVRFLEARDDVPLAHPTNHSGLAAGPGFDEAVRRGVEALLVEDALARWWACSCTPPDARPVALPEMTDERVTTTVRWMLDRCARLLPVVVASSRPSGHDHPVVTLGAARTVGAARARALWQHALSLELLDGGAGFAGGRPEGLLPHRTDRRYLSSGLDGLRAGIDPLAALQVGLDPACVQRMCDRLAVLPTTPSVREATEAPEHWVVDLTLPDVRRAGWHCVRVLAPGLRRLHVPAFGDRLPPYPGW